MRLITIISIAFLLLAGGCASRKNTIDTTWIQKRRYRPGFHLTMRHTSVNGKLSHQFKPVKSGALALPCDSLTHFLQPDSQKADTSTHQTTSQLQLFKKAKLSKYAEDISKSRHHLKSDDGSQIEPHKYASEKVYGILGITLGVASILLSFLPMFGLFISIAGLVFSLKGLIKVSKSAKLLALLGFFLSGIGFLLSLFFTVLIMAFFINVTVLI